MKNKLSPLIQLLNVVWENCKRDSWGRINYSMRRTLEIAIGSGLSCSAKDFDYISNNFRWTYWVGESTEWIYTDSIININESVTEAYEEWVVRKPFRANDVRSGYYGEAWLHTNSVSRIRERLGVGLSFPFQGTRAYVTGFDDKSGSVRAAVYANAHREGKPKKLLKLSHSDIAGMFPSKKKSALKGSADSAS